MFAFVAHRKGVSAWHMPDCVETMRRKLSQIYGRFCISNGNQQKDLQVCQVRQNGTVLPGEDETKWHSTVFDRKIAEPKSARCWKEQSYSLLIPGNRTTIYRLASPCRFYKAHD